MKYLIDTCVISELVKIRPNKKVVDWITQNNEGNFYVSSLTFGEIHKGIEKLSESIRKNTLHQWVEHDLKDRFRNRILSVDLNVAMVWGKIQAKTELDGKTLPAIDGLIAATGMAHDLTVVTRNINDMKQSGVTLLNPWK